MRAREEEEEERNSSSSDKPEKIRIRRSQKVPVTSQILEPNLRIRVADHIKQRHLAARAGGIEVEGGPEGSVEGGSAGFKACLQNGIKGVMR